MTRRLLIALLAGCLGAGACTNSADPKPSESPSPSSPGSPTPSVEQAELARLASLAARLRYDATYRFEIPAQKVTGTLRIVLALPSVRVDVTTSGTTAILIQTAARTVSCDVKGDQRKSCFLVARAGESVPDLFDPGVQRLFSDAVADLAANPLGYVVSSAPLVTLPGALPDGTCFQVERLRDPASASAPPQDPTGFETGRYCFAANGLPVLLAVQTGRITLQRLGPPPTAKLFEPVAPVTTLPSLPASPSASPSRSPSPSPSSPSPSSSPSS